MKTYSVLFGLIFLVSCTSVPKKDDAKTSSYQMDSAVMEVPKPKKETRSKIESSTEKKNAEILIAKGESLPPIQSQYSALNEAVKAQSDEKIFEAATSILFSSPNDPRALNAMGMYYYKSGRFDLAEYMLRKATSGNSELSELHNNLGVVLLGKGEVRESILSFRKALELNIDDGVASANVGALYVINKDFSKARVALENAYRKGIREPKVLNNYGIALTASGKFEQAAEIYKTVLKAQPNDRETLLNYSILLIDKLADYNEGLDTISRLKFIGGLADSRSRINALENKAKAGLK